MSIYFLAASENAGEGALAIIYLIIVVIAASLAIAWIIFPFIVISKFNELLKVARELATRAMAELEPYGTRAERLRNLAEFLV